jgi:hypothetical protein
VGLLLGILTDRCWQWLASQSPLYEIHWASVHDPATGEKTQYDDWRKVPEGKLAAFYTDRVDRATGRVVFRRFCTCDSMWEAILNRKATVFEGPMSEGGNQHGHWVEISGSPPVKTHKWYWYGRWVDDEATWHQLNGQSPSGP